MNSHIIKFTIFFLILISCSDAPDFIPPSPGTNGTPEWLVESNLVLDGGVGRDGIPSIDQPKFSKVAEIDFLNDNDLVLGIRVGDEIRAYPHPILDWHEIVNDRIGNKRIALTYCPLTGTGIGWDRMINGVATNFGVSGLLYNTNLMPYDRETGSIWSQQRLDCVNGTNIGMKAKLHSFVETTWGTWKKAFPESDILNTDTGRSINYTRYPYGDYKTNHNAFLFPISNEDDRLSSKERVLGVRINNVFKAYTFSPDEEGLEIVTDNIEGEDIIIARDTRKNFIIAFISQDHGPYQALGDTDFPFIIKDSNGIKYDLLGHSENDSDILELPEQFIGYWFSWGTFYPDIEIF